MNSKRFSILLAEDEAHKSKNVRDLCASHYPEACITEAASVRSAISRLGRECFDLILLDMSLPTFDVADGEGGGRPQGAGGMEILNEFERLRSAPRVIVVTQYADFSIDGKWYLVSELERELREEHGDVFLGLVEFDNANSDWKRSLINLMDKFFAGGVS